MAHTRKQRTAKQIARHHAKPSRAKRYARRWDARAGEMARDLIERAAAEALRLADEATTKKAVAA